MKRFYLLVCLLLASMSGAVAQFTPLGNASQTSTACFTITPNAPGQGGAIWHSQTIDLTRPFDVFATLFLGCADGGADGIVFVMHDQPVAIGLTGGGMGYQGINNSVAVEFDTWQNGNKGDPFQDHVAVVSNGDNNHNSPANLAGPVPILPTGGNVETCNFRNVRISWDPAGDSLSVWVNCDQRITYVGDIVNNIFGGNSVVYWGFVSSTGAASNLHQVCITDFNNYDPITMCFPDTVQVNAGPGTANGLTTTYTWTPATGISNASIRSPQLHPDTTTTFSVDVVDGCGVTRTRSWEVTVGYDSVLTVDLGPDTILCSGQTLDLDIYTPGIAYLWSDGLTDSARTIAVADTYWVETSNFCGTFRDTVIVNTDDTPDINLGNDTTFCQGDTLTLDATSSNATYVWQDNSGLPTFSTPNGGIYFVRVENSCGVDRDTILLSVTTPPPAFSMGNDTVLCDGNNWVIDVSDPIATSYLWQDGSTQPTFDVQMPGVYRVDVSNKCGAVSDTILIDYDSTPTVDLGPDTVLCQGQSYLFNVAFSPYTTYQWQDNSTSPVYTVINAGTYSVTLTNGCGTATDNVDITYLQPPPDPFLGNDTVLCGGSLILNSGLAGYSYLWQDGSTNPTLTVTTEATYSLRVSNKCGFEQDTIVVGFETVPEVDLGNDTTICEGQSVLLNAIYSRSFYEWENGFTGPLRNIQSQGLYEVRVYNLCGETRDQINITVLPFPEDVDLGGDQTLCEGDTLLLDATQAGFSYQWQNGSTGPTYLVRFDGTYSVRVGNACGTEVDQIRVTYLTVPEVELGEDRVICDGEPIRLDGTSPTSDVRYAWENGNTSPIRTVDEPGLYRLTVSNGCESTTDSVNVTLRDCNCVVHVPSGFSPNDDGENDEYYWAFACNLQAANFRIFDRWGQLVFQSTDPASRWNGVLPDGRLAPEGVYVWVLDYSYIGVTEATVGDQKTGTVTLLR